MIVKELINVNPHKKNSKEEKDKEKNSIIINNPKECFKDKKMMI